MNHTLVRRWIAIGTLALALPIAAAAQQAFARGAVNLRAGPSGDYPLVARLGPGQPFDVLGCTQGYNWCDVVLPDGLRGWVHASRIDYAYEDRRVPLAGYGAMIGVPIIGFTIGNYWGDHYRDRPWYREPRWWHGRPPPPPVAGWRPVPPPRPDWRPHPWHDRDPGYRPRPDPGFRPQPGWQPPPGQRPPPDHGVRPPRPDHDVRPPRPGMPPPANFPQLPSAQPPANSNFPQPPGVQPGGRPPGMPPAARPPQGVPGVPAMPGADLRQRQMDRMGRPPSSSDDRP